MKIGVIGAGRIGGNIAQRWAAAGHDLMISFSRSPERLDEQAATMGAQAGSPAQAVEFAEVVLVSVPWPALDEALAQAGPLSGRLVIDTTNQYGRGGLVTFPGGASAAHTNAARWSGARYAKAFNTLTSAFQRAVDTAGPAMFYTCAEDGAVTAVEELIGECGFVPARLPWAAAAMLESPRRVGAVYGEEYRPADAARIAVAAGTDLAEAARLAAELRISG